MISHSNRLLVVFAVAVVLVTFTTGCVTTTNNQEQGQNTAQNASNQQNTGTSITTSVVKLGETNQIGAYNKPSTGNKYVLYNATVKNVNAKDRPIFPSYFKLQDTANRAYGLDSATFSTDIQRMPDVTASSPGDVVSGTIVFQIPQNATPKALVYNDYQTTITTSL